MKKEKNTMGIVLQDKIELVNTKQEIINNQAKMIAELSEQNERQKKKIAILLSRLELMAEALENRGDKYMSESICCFCSLIIKSLLETMKGE